MPQSSNCKIKAAELQCFTVVFQNTRTSQSLSFAKKLIKTFVRKKLDEVVSRSSLFKTKWKAFPDERIIVQIVVGLVTSQLNENVTFSQ